MSDRLDELKEEATALGITFSGNIGEAKLAEKIEAFYASQETSGKELEKAIKEKEKNDKATENKPVVKSTGETVAQKRIRREAEARKTRIIIITDNDQRVNNHTTTCTVGCANEFFSLGVRVIPLNEKVEVAQGHINVLKEVMIPLHTKDAKTGLSVTKMRNRYSISYEDV